MRKKLIFLALVLTTVTAATAIAPASADTCPPNTHRIDCGTHSFCCPNNAFCVCFP
jgi:hypothetical protein